MVCLSEPIFGSVVSEPVVEEAKELVVGYTSIIGPHDTEHLLCKFWEIESVPERKHLTREEKICE